MCSQKFSVVENTERSIILRQPKIQTFSHIQRFERNYEFFLELDLLADIAHSLLSGISPKVMYVFQVFFVNFRVRILLILQFMCLLFESLVVLSDDFALKPSTSILRV